MDYKEVLENIERFLEAVSEPSMRRGFMKECSASKPEVVVLVQSALDNNIKLNSETLSILDDKDSLKQLNNLLEWLWLELGEHPSEGLHRLIIAIEERTGESFLSVGLSSNPHLTTETAGIFVKKITDNPYSSFGCEEARDIASNETTSSEDLHALFIVNDLSTRRYIAKNKNTQRKTILLFLVHKSLAVRRLVSEASYVEDSFLLYLIKEGDENAISKISKRSDLNNFIIKELLLKTSVLPFKKRLKVFFDENPEWFAQDNATERTGIKPKKNQKIEKAEFDKSVAEHKHEADRLLKMLLSELTSSNDTENERLNSLINNYEINNESWKELVIDEACPDKILKDMFIKGFDVLLNPKIQGRLRNDMTYLRCMIPNSKKIKLELASSTDKLPHISALCYKECEAKNPNYEVLNLLARNPYTDSDNLEMMYDCLGIKDVATNPNCKPKLRARVMRGDFSGRATLSEVLDNCLIDWMDED